METRYVIILDFCTGSLIKIRLSDKQVRASYQYDDFEDFLTTLEDAYGFRLKNCQWMTCETLTEYSYL
jgi:ferric-dicitrate binding protein FerR (iron transport regulator)